MTSLAYTPHDAEATAALLAQAAAEGRRIQPCGSRTKLGARAADDGAIPMSTGQLVAGLRHDAGDLVATLPAGLTLQDANRILLEQGQWLPLDPIDTPLATIGGLVAANDSGPRRHRYGTPRDLIIGIEVALTSGRVVRAGGRVVKNVAGYDLSRLFCGSHGSLGVITSATFKLSPVAAASRTVVARFDRMQHAAQFALDVASAPVTPSCIELSAPEAQVLIRFESTPRAAERMAADTAALLGSGSADVVTLQDEDEAAAWRAHGARPDGCLTTRAVVVPTAVAPLLDALELLARDLGLEWRASARAALGVVDLHVGGDAERQRHGLEQVRGAVHALHGHVRVVHVPDALAGSRLPIWDSVGSASAVGRAVKAQFDPAGILPWPWEEDAARG